MRAYVLVEFDATPVAVAIGFSAEDAVKKFGLNLSIKEHDKEQDSWRLNGVYTMVRVPLHGTEYFTKEVPQL